MTRPICVVLGVLLAAACGESGTPSDTAKPGVEMDPPAAPHGGSGSAGSSSSAGNGGSAGSSGSAGNGGGAASGGKGEGGGVASVPELWETKRAAFLQVIGRQPVALAVQETPKGMASGLLIEDFSIQSDAAMRIHGTTYRPEKTGRYPAVIYLHPTGGDRNAHAGFCKGLAGRGFFVVTIDARYHGKGQGTDAYFDAIYNAYVDGPEHPFLYDTVWDVMRLIDYLEQRADVDGERVGLVGSSKGGMETYLTAAVEPRVDVAVPWIGVQHWAWALDNGHWQARVASIQGAVDRAASRDGIATIDAAYARRFYDSVVPGIYAEFDAIEMLPAIAPRPLLVVNGDSDPKTPLAGLELIQAATREAYVAAGALENFVLRVQPETGHSVTQASLDATSDWFVQHLRP